LAYETTCRSSRRPLVVRACGDLAHRRSKQTSGVGAVCPSPSPSGW
jgi:hypothetical protein